MIKSIINFWQAANAIVKVSVMLHVIALIVLLGRPALWPWLLFAIVVNHIILVAISLWPRSQCLGTNWSQLPATAIANNHVALTIDDGPDPDVTPAVLDILEAHQVKATFFCIGNHAIKHPELCQDIIRRGHTIENHTQHHRHHFSLLGPNGFRQEIESAQNTIFSITGQQPLFFRAPAGLRNPFLDPVLRQLNLILASWSVRGFDTRNNDTQQIKSKLLNHLQAGTIFLLHDGNAARTHEGVPVIVDVLPDLLTAAKAQGLHFITLRQAL